MSSQDSQDSQESHLNNSGQELSSVNQTVNFHAALLNYEMNLADKLNVLAYTCMSVVGMVLNTMVLITAGRKARRFDVR